MLLYIAGAEQEAYSCCFFTLLTRAIRSKVVVVKIKTMSWIIEMLKSWGELQSQSLTFCGFTTASITFHIQSKSRFYIPVLCLQFPSTGHRMHFWGSVLLLWGSLSFIMLCSLSHEEFKWLRKSSAVPPHKDGHNYINSDKKINVINTQHWPIYTVVPFLLFS